MASNIFESNCSVFAQFSRQIIVKGIVLLLIVLSPLIAAGQTVTTGSLIEEMANLERLAEYPENAYRTVQYSSYDRRSDETDGPGWFANSDGFGREPIPNFEAVLEMPGEDGIGTYLLCDVEGPGAIVRGWTARIDGTLKVYLDESDTPIYQGPSETFLQETYLLFLEETQLDSSLFEGSFIQRDAGYFPIPFEENLRVEWTGNLNNLHFYELQVRKYEQGTDVKTFQPQDLNTYSGEIKRVARMLNNPDEKYSDSSNGNTHRVSAALAGGETEDIFTFDGEAALQRIVLKLDADNVEKALRQTVLSIQFDNVPKGQVQVPLGDFFGAAPGINPFVSLPFTVQSDGTMISRFVMPFAESVQIKVENKGSQKVEVNGSVMHADYKWDPERSMHFRARWRVNHNINKSSPYDLPFIIAKGQGVYVGSSSLLYNPIEIPTAGGNWWGEGDEKIYVDDDSFPSIFGTGSEDYYNYSWSSSDIFQTPYSGQPRNDGPATRGFVTNHRWHILDPMPFSSDLQFYMEFFPHTHKSGFSYARTSYFYARPGLMDDHMPISGEDVRHLEHNRWSPRSAGAARNSVFYQVEELLNEPDKFIMKEGNLWAEGELFVWKPEKTEETLTIPFDISEKGTYGVWLTAAKMERSGKISIRINGQEVGFGGSDGIIDLTAPDRRLLRNFRSEDLSFDSGSHSVTVKYEGGDVVGKGIEIGLDFLWIQKQ